MNKIKHNEGYIFIKAPKWWSGKIYSKMYCLEHHYVYFINTGILPKVNEIIHHIDGDKANNIFSNLELQKRDEHSSLHKKPVLWAILKCPCCNKIYKRKFSNLRKQERKHQAPYCSKKCQGIMTREGRPEGVSFETCLLTSVKV